MTKELTHYEQIILDNIDLSDRGFNPKNESESIELTHNVFLSEYSWGITTYGGEVRAFAEWLKGLPSVLTVPFENYIILLNAETFGNESLNTEEQEDEYLQNYWLNLAKAFFKLKHSL